MKWLGADDDNGNILDGTPHMTALYNAFHRHAIACSPNVPAALDTTTIGSVVPGTSYEDTPVSDDDREILEEGLDELEVSRVDNVWRFDDILPDVPRSLVLEGWRPVNSDGDNFQFYWSNDGVNYTAISGALINKVFEPVGGLVYPFGGAFSPTVYIKALDTSGTGSNLARLHVDRLRIGDNSVEPGDSGCPLRLTAGPTLTVTVVSGQKSLTWTSVSGAAQYWVFRTEGHAGCDLGMARVAKVYGGATTFVDSDVMPGRAYYYAVMASNGAEACFGRASTCQAAPLE